MTEHKLINIENSYPMRVLTPRVLASPEELSAKTLRMIYSSVKSLKDGKAGSAVDFKRYKKKAGYAKVKLSNLPLSL
ncbi:MAG TPA: hypothetical protein VF335_02710, partial [Chitinivibrionales bacterium]